MRHFANPTLLRCRHGHREQGAATLIVVMLLFFIMSMVAAYTSRNLIFEQRTSANQYRSSQAFEAAEAGLEWAIAQLNAGRMTSTCGPSTVNSDLSFAQRYLIIDTATGAITPRPVSGLGTAQSVQPRCVFNSSASDPANWNWSCSCPLADAAAPTLAVPAGTGPAPAYVLRFQPPAAGGRPDLVQLDSNSCTRLDPSCISFAAVNRGGTGDGVASTSVVLALRGALTRPPAAALSVAGDAGGNTLTLSSGSLALTNLDGTVGGLTLHTTGVAPFAPFVPPSGLSLTGLPGVPPASSTLTDATLKPELPATPPTGMTQAERTFGLFFGVFSNAYFAQPGMVEVNCSVSCDAAAVNQALLRNPGRAIRLRGTGMFTVDANIGTASPMQPALLIVEGPVTFSNGVTLVGMIYGRPAAWGWTVNGTANIQGAAVAEQALAVAGTSGDMRIAYDKAVLTALRVSYGTFVRVPGSWKDFQ